jgi:hypothetical protein
MPDIIRLCRLYNVPSTPARRADKRKKQKARKARPARKGLFDMGKTKVFEDIIARPGASPNIPGTDVPRLQLFSLGPKAKATTSDEITRVTEGLQRCSQAKRAASNVEHITA